MSGKEHGREKKAERKHLKRMNVSEIKTYRTGGKIESWETK